MSTTLHEAAVQQLMRATVTEILNAAQVKASVLVNGEERVSFIISALGMAYVSAAEQLAPTPELGMATIREQLARMIATVEASR